MCWQRWDAGMKICQTWQQIHMLMTFMLDSFEIP